MVKGAGTAAQGGSWSCNNSYGNCKLHRFNGTGYPTVSTAGDGYNSTISQVQGPTKLNYGSFDKIRWKQYSRRWFCYT